MCPEPDVNEVQTRAQKQQKEAELQADQDADEWPPKDQLGENDEEAEDGLPRWEDDMFLPDKGPRKQLTRSEKRNNDRNLQHLSSVQHPLDGGAVALGQAQEEDPSLADIKQRVEEGDESYEHEDGLIYRLSRQTAGNELVRQLVLPMKYSDIALRTAHVVPMAGHLGRKKTQDRLLDRFFWPGLYSDVAEMCRSCPECQRAARHKKHRC